mgnify:CR=1 FL=1
MMQMKQKGFTEKLFSDKFILKASKETSPKLIYLTTRHLMNFARLGGLGDERILPAPGTIRIAGMQTTTCSRTEKKVKKK